MMMQYNLNGTWKMREIGQQDWLDVAVPGSVMNDLLTNEKIEDPFYRDNEDEALVIAEKDFEYVRQFTVEDEWLTQDQIVLRCEGLDTLATIYVNDIETGSTNNMHRTYEFDVKKLLKKGANDIKILLRSPINYLKTMQEEQPLTGVDHAVEGYPHLRKAHSMFGWDWGPKIPDLGIWRDISLVGWDVGRIEDVYITQNHSADQVELNVKTDIEKWSEDAVDLVVSLTDPAGKTTSKTVVASNLNENISFIIEQPELWWPNGYGEQPLYEVTVAIKTSGQELDQKKYRIGLRTIEVKHEPDQWGKSFEFYVNGISLFAKGANYIPEDSLIPRTSRERTEQLIQDCVEAHYNMIRVWGGGYYPSDDFYELCDQYGLIVWQDFMFACSVYDLTKDFEATVKQEAIDNIKRIRHHASLGMWCGNNEIEEGWEYWGWPQSAKFRADYLKLFEIILRDIVEEFDPQTFYWPSSPSSGGGFDEPRNPDVGDMHYWEVWHGRKPFTEYRKYHFRFCSEFGFQSFPSHKTIETFTLPSDRNVFSYVMEKHQKNDGANGIILSYLADTFLYPKDFAALLYTSQLLQAEAIKYGVEHWRRNRGRCMGSLYWQLNDCWPVASWSSIDYFGRWKALHYFAKRFYDPILLSIEEEGTDAAIYVTNDTLEDIKVTVEWKLRTNDSTILKEGNFVQNIASLTAKNCEALSFDLSKEEMRETYLETTLYLDDQEYSSTTVLFTPPKHFKFLDPNLQVDVVEENDVFIITVSADHFAKYVELDLSNADCTFSHNYFDLSAGTPKKIIVDRNRLTKELSLENFSKELVVRSAYDITE